MTTDASDMCEVCSEAMDPDHSAFCSSCGRTFHLTWDTRLEIKDCGAFALDDQTLALYFTCVLCGGAPQEAGERPS